MSQLSFFFIFFDFNFIFVAYFSRINLTFPRSLTLELVAPGEGIFIGYEDNGDSSLYCSITSNKDSGLFFWIDYLLELILAWIVRNNFKCFTQCDSKKRYLILAFLPLLAWIVGFFAFMQFFFCHLHHKWIYLNARQDFSLNKLHLQILQYSQERHMTIGFLHFPSILKTKIDSYFCKLFYLVRNTLLKCKEWKFKLLSPRLN